MSVEVADEAAVVGLAILRTRPRWAIGAGSRLQGCGIEGLHGCLVRGDETEVAAVADAGRLAVDRLLHPELRILAAPGHRTGMGQDALAAERGQNLIVKGDGLIELVGANGDMGQDAWICCGHADSSLDNIASLAARALLCRLRGAEHEAAKQHHRGEQLEKTIEDVQQQAADRIWLLTEQLQGPVVQ